MSTNEWLFDIKQGIRHNGSKVLYAFVFDDRVYSSRDKTLEGAMGNFSKSRLLYGTLHGLRCAEPDAFFVHVNEDKLTTLKKEYKYIRGRYITKVKGRRSIYMHVFDVSAVGTTVSSSPSASTYTASSTSSTSSTCPALLTDTSSDSIEIDAHVLVARGRIEETRRFVQDIPPRMIESFWRGKAKADCAQQTRGNVLLVMAKLETYVRDLMVLISSNKEISFLSDEQTLESISQLVLASSGALHRACFDLATKTFGSVLRGDYTRLQKSLADVAWRYTVDSVQVWMVLVNRAGCQRDTILNGGRELTRGDVYVALSLRGKSLDFASAHSTPPLKMSSFNGRLIDVVSSGVGYVSAIIRFDRMGAKAKLYRLDTSDGLQLHMPSRPLIVTSNKAKRSRSRSSIRKGRSPPPLCLSSSSPPLSLPGPPVQAMSERMRRRLNRTKIDDVPYFQIGSEVTAKAFDVDPNWARRKTRETNRVSILYGVIELIDESIATVRWSEDSKTTTIPIEKLTLAGGGVKGESS